MQIFFIAPQGYMQVRNALRDVPGQRTHGWSADGTTQVIGVAEVSGDTEHVAVALESTGCLLMPDHRFDGPLSPAIVSALAGQGITASDTCCSALQKIHAISGFPPHRMKRYA